MTTYAAPSGWPLVKGPLTRLTEADYVQRAGTRTHGDARVQAHRRVAGEHDLRHAQRTRDGVADASRSRATLGLERCGHLHETHARPQRLRRRPSDAMGCSTAA